MKKFGKLITLTGAYLGFLIGSGVATGQELMQYYSPYGFKVFGTAITIAIILIVANFGFSYAGKNGNLKTGGDVLHSTVGNMQDVPLIFSRRYSVICLTL